MINKDQFRSAANKAVGNVVKHGDTDIFPFPFENHLFSDLQEEVVDLIVEYDAKFEEYLSRFSPQNISSLTPVTYWGFRWATQIDPIWNLVFLTHVIALSEKIEEVRASKDKKIVFSYRFMPDKKTGDLFDRAFGWASFMRHSAELSNEFEFVVACDISEFYPRLSHHRLENALQQIAGDTPYPKKIIGFLSNYSNTRSLGLPIGGPAARLLSELTINQIDQLLISDGVIFTRFADDYHLFASSRQEAYRHLILLSEKLFENQGLSLQKSKTRIMTAAEFRTTSPLKNQDAEDEPEKEGEAGAAAHKSGQLLRFSLRFDPYSATADADYERLKSEIRQFDIIGLLKEELAKSRVHTALARKIIGAIKFLEGTTKEDAVLSILNNFDVLYPIFSSVLLMIEQVYSELSQSAAAAVVAETRKLINEQSHVFRVDVHLSYAIRVLAHAHTAENQALLQRIYTERSSPLIRRDIILVMAQWGEWYWLSDRRNRFRELTGAERRAFIVASYKLKDEGDHWRKHIKEELSPFELLVLRWAGKKSNDPKWKILL